MAAEPGCDDHKLYDLNSNMRFQLVCPVQKYENISIARIEQVEFYQSKLGMAINS